MSLAERDANRVTTLLGVDSLDEVTPRKLMVDESTGRLLVTATISGGGAGGTSSTDDSAFTVGSGSGTPAMGLVTSDSVDSGDVGVLGMLANRQLKVTLFDSGGSELSVGGGTQYTEDAAAAANPVGNALNLVRDDARGGSLTTTDGDNVAARGTNAGELYVKHVDSIPATQSGTWNITNVSGTVSLPTGAATAAKQPALGTAGTASADVITVQGIASMTALKTDGSAVTQPVSASSLPLPTGAATAANQQTDALTDTQLRASAVPVSLASVPSHAVTNAGTFAVQESGSALTALQLIDDPVFADDAAYTLSTSKGQVIEGVAVETDGTDPTTVSAEGDAAALRTDRQRVLLVNPTPPRNWSVSADYGSAQTNTSVKAAPGSGLKLYITDISISNGATAGNITLLDGSGGTVLYEIYPAVNGGAVDNRRSPIVLTANTALCITSTTVTTHSINVSGYIAP